MDVTTLRTSLATRLVGHIEDRRREITASILLAGDPQHNGSIAASMFANTFLDRLVLELETGNRDHLDAWANVGGDGEIGAEHGRLVVLACANVTASYIAAHGSDAEAVRYLAVRGSELEHRLESARRHVRRERPIEPHKLVSRDDVVASLLSAVDARDPATAEHSRAVGQWSIRIAKSLGMSLEQQDLAGLSGTLHDIGKVATPTEILLKPDALSEAEWSEMREHAIAGAKMLEQIPSLKHVAPYIRSHHERLDGLGYPDRLAGEQIPLLSRIVAVADAFHAMISKRPYREAIPVPKAVRILIDGKGTQWDPIVVETMVSLVRPFTAQRTLRAVSGNDL